MTPHNYGICSSGRGQWSQAKNTIPGNNLQGNMVAQKAKLLLASQPRQPHAKNTTLQEYFQKCKFKNSKSGKARIKTASWNLCWCLWALALWFSLCTFQLLLNLHLQIEKESSLHRLGAPPMYPHNLIQKLLSSLLSPGTWSVCFILSRPHVQTKKQKKKEQVKSCMVEKAARPLVLILAALRVLFCVCSVMLY